MAALDFPPSPINGQEYTHPDTGTIYVWNGTQWILKFSATGAFQAPDASTTTKGIIQIATNPEVNTGTNTTKAVTPAQLASALAAVTGINDASETVKGIVELATIPEAQTGTDTARAVTPAGLAARTPDATDTVKGLVELATPAESVTGTDTVRVVTPAGLAARTPNSSTGARGLIQLASGPEVIAGTDAVKAISPATLQALTALTTRAGIIQLADSADILAGTDTSKAVTPAQLAASTTLPGSIVMWGSEVVPNGWLECNGGKVSRTNYAALFDALVTVLNIPPVTTGLSWSGITFSKVGHGLTSGRRIRFLNSGTVPSGALVNTDYFVNVTSPDTFILSTDRYLNGSISSTADSGGHYQESIWGLGDAVDNPTNFHLPYITDFVRSRKGGIVGVHQLDEFKEHGHNINGSHPSASGSNPGEIPGSNSGILSGLAGGSETRPKNITLTFIIKT